MARPRARPYAGTGLSNATLTAVASSYGTKYFTPAFINGSGCQRSLSPATARNWTARRRDYDDAPGGAPAPRLTRFPAAPGG